MNKRNLSVITGLSLTVLAFGLFSPATIASAQSTGGQALEIAPPVMVLTADPGQVINAKITLRNVSNGSLIVGSQVNDFVAGGEDGTPKIIMDGDESSPYSIKDWIGFLPDLTLKAKQLENLPVTITVPANAAPGGYYGVVRFTATPPELEGTGVSLSASLGALILLRVNGEAKESMTIEDFSINKNGKAGSLFETTPLQFVERIKNNGNIHEQPAGQITITDMFGNKVAAVNINLPPSNILPDSIRKFEQPLDSAVLGKKILFGRYTAELKVTYGASKQVITKTITFWVIPFTMIAAGIVALIATFLALRYAIKRYNRYIRNQALGITKSKKK